MILDNPFMPKLYYRRSGLSEKLSLVVVGPGLIGQKHIELIQEHRDCSLSAIVAPNHIDNINVANLHNVELYFDIDRLLNSKKVDGIIISSPNVFHVDQALKCLEHGIPVLLEKPIADTYEEGLKLLHATNEKKGKLLIGHHRIHSPILATAKKIIREGIIGDIVGITGSALFFKPPDYFESGPWRSQLGGGPILINLIHEIGNFRELCGEISQVQAITSSRIRNFPVEDSAVINFQFENGALGSFFLSDTASSSKSWEQTSGENKSFAQYPVDDCYEIAGTKGMLSIPSMRIKSYKGSGAPSWMKMMDDDHIQFDRTDPLEEQFKHFIRVIRNNEEPKVTAYDGLQNLKVVEAIFAASKFGTTIKL